MQQEFRFEYTAISHYFDVNISPTNIPLPRAGSPANFISANFNWVRPNEYRLGLRGTLTLIS